MSTRHLILATFLVFVVVSLATANPISIEYARLSRGSDYQKLSQAGVGKKPTQGLANPFLGKSISAISPISRVTIWHNYSDQVDGEMLRKKLPSSNILWILEHYSLAQKSDSINVPAGIMVEIHYENGVTLRLNTLDTTVYGGVIINQKGEYEPIGLQR